MASTAKIVSSPLSKNGTEPAEAMLAFQKELVDSYEQANDACLPGLNLKLSYGRSSAQSCWLPAPYLKQFRPIRSVGPSDCVWLPKMGKKCARARKNSHKKSPVHSRTAKRGSIAAGTVLWARAAAFARAETTSGGRRSWNKPSRPPPSQGHNTNGQS
jgi:hypothetical protein